jgi:hypothetical protein
MNEHLKACLTYGAAGLGVAIAGALVARFVKKPDANQENSLTSQKNLGKPKNIETPAPAPDPGKVETPTNSILSKSIPQADPDPEPDETDNGNEGSDANAEFD